ncbi:MAG TPA: sigma-54 dependent transcriptional regulator, partial [Bacteroidales bacterium]|nr:sigma-54 dependent transcriptional regulator [Bacteroidales bacterium]
MKSHRATILVLDDESGIRTEIRDFLDSGRIRVLLAAAPSEAFSILSGQPVDLAIVDIRLPEMSGLEVLKEIKRKFPGTAVIMMSGHGDMDSVIVALRDGAVDYFKKPFRLQDLLQSVEKNLKVQVAARRLMGTNGAMNFEEAFGSLFSPSMIAVSPAMIAVVEKMHLVARSRDTTVLITGESGTGKELIARGIHQISSRRDMPFHPANCSSIPDELFESEFFGYKKGAFTGATADKPGWFEAADRGTLFLDEVGDLKINLQAKLLRVMDDRQITRLGSTATRRVDVRIITATNQDLEALIEKGRFRTDLYH